MTNDAVLVLGMLAMGFMVSGIVFLSFWRKSRDRLFGAFALAFFMFAAERIGLALVGYGSPIWNQIILLRLAASVLILLAIIDKNRKV